MLDAQGVVDVLLKLDVRVDFVRHGNGWVKPQSARGTAQRLHWSERTEPFRTLAVSVAHYFTLTSIAFDLAIVVVGRCTFSTPSRNSAVTFVLSASSGSVKLRRKVPKDRSMRWNFFF
jgi:hypothetical protein